MTSAMMRSTPTIVQIRPEPRMAVYLSWGEGLTFETLPGCCDGNEFEPLVGFSIPRKQMATVPAAAGRETADPDTDEACVPAAPVTFSVPHQGSSLATSRDSTKRAQALHRPHLYRPLEHHHPSRA